MDVTVSIPTIILLHCVFMIKSSSNNEIFSYSSDLKKLDTFKSTFLSLIHYNLKFQSAPRTIRFVTLENLNSYHDDLIQWALQEETKNYRMYAFLTGNNKPFVDSPDLNSITTGGIRGKIEMIQSYIVIVYVSNFNEQKIPLMNIVEKSINKRHDRTMFITQNKETVAQMANLEIVQGLRDKYFIYVNSESNNEILTDPLIYDASNKAALISVFSTDDFPVRKKIGGLLRGRHLKTGQSEIFHWAYIEKSKEKNGKDYFTGSFVNIQMESMKRFNYTLDIELLDTYAALLGNGTWIGTTGCVLNGDCDLSICLSPEYLWGSQMDFSPWIDTTKLVFWTNFPRKDPKWYGFLLPFTPFVWACLFVSIIIFGLVLLIIVLIKQNCKWTRHVLETGVQLPIAILLEQDLPSIPTGILRYLTGMWLFAAIIIGTGYRSTLRKNLIFPPEDIVPLTHPDLAERTDYKSVLYSFGELEIEHFRASTDSKIQKIYKRLQLTDDRVGCLEDVVLNYKQTCSSWYPPSAMLVAKYLTLDSRFDPIAHSKDHIALSYMTLAFPKNSILVDTFSEIISAIVETGIYIRFAEEETNKLKKKGVEHWESKKDKDHSKIYKVLKRQADTRDDSDTKALSFETLVVVFLFLPIGGIVGLVVFILEKRQFSLRREDEKESLSTPVVTLVVREYYYRL